MQSALRVKKYNAKDSPEALEGYDAHAAPPEKILDSVNGKEDSTPVQQNGCLNQGERGRVAAAVDEDKLIKE
jgi:hypothetical protein